MHKVTKTNKEIDDLLEQAFKSIAEGKSKYHGMTYEQGIEATLCWVFDLGYDGPHPLEDE